MSAFCKILPLLKLCVVRYDDEMYKSGDEVLYSYSWITSYFIQDKIAKIKVCESLNLQLNQCCLGLNKFSRLWL